MKVTDGPLLLMMDDTITRTWTTNSKGNNYEY